MESMETMRTYSIPILTFHDISARDTRVSITSAFLTRVLDYFAQRNYEAITVSTLLKHLEGEVEQQLNRVVLLTFDDVCSSVLERALPRLEERGFVGNAFLATKYIGQTNRAFSGELDEMDLLGMDGLRLLEESGWEIHSHTHSHPDLTDASDDQMRTEMEKSRRLILDYFDTDPDYLSLAYPYNATSSKVQEICSEYMAAGFNGGGVPFRGFSSRMNMPRIEPEQGQHLKFVLKLYRVRFSELFQNWF